MSGYVHLLSRSADGTTKVRRKALWKRKGLAVSTSLSRGWFSITHVASGLKVHMYRSESRAIACARGLVKIVDWSSPSRSLFRKLPEDKQAEIQLCIAAHDHAAGQW